MFKGFNLNPIFYCTINYTWNALTENFILWHVLFFQNWILCCIFYNSTLTMCSIYYYINCNSNLLYCYCKRIPSCDVKANLCFIMRKYKDKNTLLCFMQQILLHTMIDTYRIVLVGKRYCNNVMITLKWMSLLCTWFSETFQKI